MQSKNFLIKLIEEKQWNLVKARCQTHPRETRTKSVFLRSVSNSKVLSIHFCCESNPPSGVVQDIVRAYPKGVKEQEQRLGLLPLHIACSEGASLAVVRELLRLFPSGIQSKDFQGRLPLHYALSNKANTDVIMALINFWPRGALAADVQGWLPLHNACAFSTARMVAERLIDIFPDALWKRTRAGKLPVDYVKNTAQDSELIVLMEQSLIQKRDKENIGELVLAYKQTEQKSKSGTLATARRKKPISVQEPHALV